MRNFRTLQVWQKAHRLVIGLYEASGKFPKDELYGLTSQMRRAAVSIASNIAEACGRAGDPELARFLRYSMGSAGEAEYLLLLVFDLKYMPIMAVNRLIQDVTEIKRMLTGFLQRLEADRISKEA